MSETNEITSLADLEFDLAGDRARAAWVTSLGSQGPTDPNRNLVVRSRNATARQSGAAGDALTARRPPESRARYRTVRWVEDQYAAAPAGMDFACLIASACQVVESELAELLLGPAAEIGGALADLLTAEGKVKQAEILRLWAEGTFPATVGTSSLVLMALRYGIRSGHERCLGFLAEHFTPDFAALAGTKELGALVDAFRCEYRNPACHGLRSFGPVAYQHFVRLVVARERFADWATGGPHLGDSPGSLGLLHHHLAGSTQVAARPVAPAEPEPAERLLSLTESRGSALAVRLELVAGEPAAPPDLRDLRPRHLPGAVRVGDTVRFRLRADRACEVALIDIGTTGAVAVLLPNHWVARATIAAGQTVMFPAAGVGDFDFELGGPPGTERVLAVAWEGNPGYALAPRGEQPFRELGPTDVIALCDAVRALPADRWAACAVVFEAIR